MKKILFLLIAAHGASSAFAQTADPNVNADSARTSFVNDSIQNSLDSMKSRIWAADSFLSRWVLDVNGLAGVLTHDITQANTFPNYTNGIKLNTGKLKFTNGMSYGGDIQLGYFFGNKAHFGVGTGFMYLYQTGDLTLDQFNVQYQSVDSRGNTFRQLITANRPVVEKLEITNMNIPLMLKYKNRFTKRIGFNMDLGILYNLQLTNVYKTNASFDYEAIYKYVPSTNGTDVAVYDNETNPSVNSLLITKDAINRLNNGNNVADTFNFHRNVRGRNVGLNQEPDKKDGSTSYTQGSVGFMAQPSLSIFFSDRVALNLGVYYMYQPFTNSAKSGYRLTDKVGEYTSVTSSVTSNIAQSYGGNLGLRYYLHKLKDSDGDGIPDKKDKCPNDSGALALQGCPDKDGDGIIDMEDSCVDVAGLPKFNGCPDTDGDEIPDKDDACPTKAGPLMFKGCPDSDGDYIPDREDDCPTVAGLPKFKGCPDTDGDGLPDKEDKCPNEYGPASNGGCPLPPPPPSKEKTERPDISTPILFDVNKTTINAVSFPVLETAIYELNEDVSSFIVIDGYTDNTGREAYNKVLSTRRANAVKAYLTTRGINGKRLQAVGHGINDPIADNSTIEGRAKNRRVIMSLKHGRGK